MKIHEKYMTRCIELAGNGLGRTYPNPMVGSVLVYNNRIIGEGWHQKSGANHAEVNAINAVKNRDLLSKSTLYVSLEPCSHFGKTPPCSNLIIEKGIKKVVIGTVDPFAEVAGRGIKKLMEAGCEVQVGVMEKECQTLNRRFFTFHQKHRPYIILKWAQSADGFLSPPQEENHQRQPVWITGKYSRQLVHKWRGEEQAILVGTNTAVADNPKLDARLYKGENPVRVVLDRSQRIPVASHLFDNSEKTLVLTQETSGKRSAKNVIFETLDFNQNLPRQIGQLLYQHNIQSVIIEGGRQTLQSFIDVNLWDEARIFTGSVQFKKGVNAPNFSGKLISETLIHTDELKIYKND